MATDAAKQSFLDVPSIAIITGASKGIGRAIALELVKRSTDILHLVLTGRSEKDLQETLSLIKCSSKYDGGKMTVKLVIGDLRNQEEFPNLSDNLFKDIDSTRYRHAILFNNAGSPGDVTKYSRDFSPLDVPHIQDYFFLNVTSTLLLASKFLKVFHSCEPSAEQRLQMKRNIVQITSLGGLNAQASWSLYCTGKAARDMLHKVIAVEEPEVRVLSYAPGPVDTAMFHQVMDQSAAPSTAKMMANCHKVAVTPEKTAGVLCDVLRDDEYESGAHIDLFDITGPPGGDS